MGAAATRGRQAAYGTAKDPLFHAPTGLADGLAQKEQRYAEVPPAIRPRPRASALLNAWLATIGSPVPHRADGGDSAIGQRTGGHISEAARRLRYDPLHGVLQARWRVHPSLFARTW